MFIHFHIVIYMRIGCSEVQHRTNHLKVEPLPFTPVRTITLASLTIFKIVVTAVLNPKSSFDIIL